MIIAHRSQMVPGVKQACVLVVEKDQLAQENLKSKLSQFGFDVECCQNAQDALERAKRKKYGLVVANLTCADGLEIGLHAMHECFPRLVIYSSSNLYKAANQSDRCSYLDRVELSSLFAVLLNNLRLRWPGEFLFEIA